MVYIFGEGRYFRCKNDAGGIMVVIAVNLKAYAEAAGERALLIARAMEELQGKDVRFILIPALPDTTYVARNTKIDVFLQHVDPVEPGARTGKIPMGLSKVVGVKGVLINHSEDPAKINTIEILVDRAQEMGLETIVCAPDERVAAALSQLQPDFVAVEPPELIGTGISVSQAKPEVVRKSFEAVRGRSRLLVGAGIHSGEDVKRAVELGAEGVLLASAVAKASNPREVLEDLISKL